MAIAWNEGNMPFLKKQLEAGNVILFAGAGFSADCVNIINGQPPLGGKLAALLAERASLPYDGEPLSVVYTAAERMIGSLALWSYLEDLYTIKAFPDWYKIVRSVTWYRIYTTNIDNLFQDLYPTGSNQRIRTIVHPAPPEERDQLFSNVQCVHLHGHVQYKANGLTFSLADFARQSTKPNPWYQTLIDDLYTRPVLFVGTLLEESPFHHYLELRETRDRTIEEFRPKSFLVCPNISPIRSATLKDRNILGIEASGKEFFSSLLEAVDIAELSVSKVRGRVLPHVTIRLDTAELDEGIGRYFDLIQPDRLPPVKEFSAGQFFFGTEPSWNDIRSRHDGRRVIVTDLLTQIKAVSATFSCVVLHGPAGSGKTTTMMRAAQELASDGNLVFYAKSLERLDLTRLLAVIKKHMGQRHFVFIDVMSRQLGSIDKVKKAMEECANLTLVLSDRSNAYFSRCQAITDLNPTEVRMPDLCEADVIAILERLEHFGYLGVLKGVPRTEQVQAFMVRASKQLLVAMREATSGKGFNAILQSEFNELAQPAKLAYTICCLAVAAGAPGVYRRHLTPCLSSSEFKKASIINDMLRGVLVPANQTGTMLMPRHRLIAHWTAIDVVPAALKVEATTTFLKQISADIVPHEIKRRSPAFVAYRGMINLEHLYEMFNSDMELTIGIYEELRTYYGQDFLFWLQFGMAHARSGHLDIAENYLNQSRALYPNSHQTEHHMGIIYLMQASLNPNSVASQERAKEGIAILKAQIRSRGDFDSYPYGAYMAYVLRWYVSAGRLIPDADWENLRRVGQEATKKYFRDDIIHSAANDIERAYLFRAVREPE